MDDDFIKALADHEEEKVKAEKKDREKIIMYSGARLNWIGDYLGNPQMKWKERELELDEIEFTGNDDFLISTCKRSPKEFQNLVLGDAELYEMYERFASYGGETILVRNSDHDFVKYKVLDGIHRVIGAALSKKKTIKAMVPLNESQVLPNCEPHIVYDLIRGFIRHRHTEEGETELFHALKLLLKTYSNVRDLLENRFNFKYVSDEKTQIIIKKVLED